MSAEEEFKANMSDVFFDYDAYDVRPDQQATLSKDAAYSEQPSDREDRHWRLLRRTRIQRIQPRLSVRTAPTPSRMRSSRLALPATAFASSATAKKSPSAPNQPKPAGSRTAAAASRSTSNTPWAVRRHHFPMPPFPCCLASSIQSSPRQHRIA